MKKPFFLLLIIIISTNIFSQIKRNSYDFETLGLFDNFYREGKIIITSDYRLPNILKNYINYFNTKQLYGWRIQLYFGLGKQGKQKAIQIKDKFSELYPDIPVYLYFEQPYFKVKVGNFISKKSAQRLLYFIKQDFPSAFIIEDRININLVND